MTASQTTPWSEMSREERSARLGEPSRWEQPRAATAAWEDDLIDRYRTGKPLSKADAREARRLIRARA